MEFIIIREEEKEVNTEWLKKNKRDKKGNERQKKQGRRMNETKVDGETKNARRKGKK